WMCDEGRYSYKSADAPTRLKASSRLGEGGKPLQMEPDAAADAVARELKALVEERGPQGLGFLLGGSMTVEDLFAARALMDHLGVPRSNAVVAPSPEQLGEEDDLLRRKEKVANLKGAELLGFDLKAALPKGAWGLWAVDRGPAAAPKDLAFSLWQGANAVPFALEASWVLAASHHTEEDAVVVNFEGRAQRLRRAVPPLGESRPDWEWFAAVLRSLGGSFPYADAEAVFRAAFPAAPGYDFPPAGLPAAELAREGAAA
ncbi:MAG: molybdopterin-dependent oxidoreductase, partial [Elusimicrobia bacterium]|nr:molybdopterin-dependent oxidoreductase [Elusimicrobiota bacterium]